MMAMLSAAMRLATGSSMSNKGLSSSKNDRRLLAFATICLGYVVAGVCFLSIIQQMPAWGRTSAAQGPNAAAQPGNQTLLPLWWFAPFFDRTSYGKEATTMILSLARSGLVGDSVWIGATQADCKYSGDYSMPVQDFEQLDTLNRRWVMSQPAIVVCHSLPSYWTRPKRKWDSCAPCPPKDYTPAYAIGRCMAETDMYNKEFVESCKHMDEVWVPSNFSQEVLVRSGVGADKVRVVPIATNTTWFDPEEVEPMQLPRGQLAFGQQKQEPQAAVEANATTITTSPQASRRSLKGRALGFLHHYPKQKKPFVFVSCFKWEMRKGWDALLSAYLQEFNSTDNVEMYIMTKPFMTGNNFIKDMHSWAQTNLKIMPADHPRMPTLSVISDHLSDLEYRSLLKASDAYVIATRGEGWGMPIAEAMSMGLPVVVTNWSGVTAFVDEEVGYMVDYSLTQVPAKEPAWLLGGKWADPNVDSLRKRLREVVSDPATAAKKGRQARERIVARYSPTRMAHVLKEEMTRITGIVRSRQQTHQ